MNKTVTDNKAKLVTLGTPYTFCAARYVSEDEGSISIGLHRSAQNSMDPMVFDFSEIDTNDVHLVGLLNDVREYQITRDYLADIFKKLRCGTKPFKVTMRGITTTPRCAYFHMNGRVIKLERKIVAVQEFCNGVFIGNRFFSSAESVTHHIQRIVEEASEDHVLSDLVPDEPEPSMSEDSNDFLNITVDPFHFKITAIEPFPSLFDASENW